jgi:hypothetical protein
MATETTTRRSPVRPRPSGGMPRPFKVIVSPGCVPAGSSTGTSPSNVGTWIVPPSAASGAATSTTVTRSSPSRRKRSSSRTRTPTYRSPGGPPRSPAWPRPETRIRCPSAIPAGTLTSTRRGETVIPRPSHVWHGVSATRPSPPHWSHSAVRTIWPKRVRWTAWIWPAPPQRGQVTIGVPGSAPLPRQVSHVAVAS